MARTSHRKESRPRGAAPRNGGGGGKRWPLFVGGLAVGLLLSGGVYLASILPTAMDLRERARLAEAERAAVAAGETRPGTNAGKPGATKGQDEGKKPVTFEFYSILPQQEVVAPVSGNKTTVAPVSPVTNTTSPATPPTPAATASPAGKDRYQLQAGSFRTRAEADRRRAELLLSGHSVNVQDVTTGSGDQWFRVMVGPFDGEDVMQRARQQLAAGKIETLPIRLR